MACSKSELELFEIPQTQLAIESNLYSRISSLQASNKSSLAPIEFLINSSSEYFLDPSNIILYAKLSIKDRENKPIDENYELYFENNILHTMFSDIEIFLNDTKISIGGGNYAYRAFFENLLSFSSEEKLSKLIAEGFYPASQKNNIIKKFKAYKSKTIEVYGKLHLDLFFQPRLILSGCDIRLKLHKQSIPFCIKSAATNSEVISNIDVSKLYIDFEEIYLDVRKVKLTPHVYLDIEKHLNHSPAKYPISRADLKSFTLNEGISSQMINHVAVGKLPTRILFGLVPHSSYNGDIFTSGLEFYHHNLKSASVYLNGSLFAYPIICDFSDVIDTRSLHLKAYKSIFSELSGDSDICDISYDDYKKYYCIYAFDLSQDRCVNAFEHVNPVQNGDLSISLEFKKPIEKNLTLITYAEFPGIVQLDKTRTAFTDF